MVLGGCVRGWDPPSDLKNLQKCGSNPLIFIKKIPKLRICSAILENCPICQNRDFQCDFDLRPLFLQKNGTLTKIGRIALKIRLLGSSGVCPWLGSPIGPQKSSKIFKNVGITRWFLSKKPKSWPLDQSKTTFWRFRLKILVSTTAFSVARLPF